MHWKVERQRRRWETLTRTMPNTRNVDEEEEEHGCLTVLKLHDWLLNKINKQLLLLLFILLFCFAI